MRLAQPAELLTMLGIQQTSSTIATASLALVTSYTEIESRLDCTLKAGERLDTFVVPARDPIAKRFRLSNGFVYNENVQIEVDGEAVAAENYTMDLALGVFEIYGLTSSASHVVTARYSCGFTATLKDPETLNNAPPSLVQANLLLAAAAMQRNPAAIPKEKAKLMGTSIEAYSRQAATLIEPYQRPRGSYIWTTETEVL